MSDPFVPIYREVELYADPILAAISDRDALEYLLYRHGWNVDIASEAFDILTGDSGLSDAVADFADQLSKLGDDGGTPQNDFDLTTFLNAATTVLEAIETLGNANLTELPEAISDPDTWTTFGGAVVDTLTADYFELRTPKLYAMLGAVGAIESLEVEAEPPFRRRHTRHHINWDALAATLTDPVGHTKSLYRWDHPSEPFDHGRMIDSVASIAAAFGIAAHLDFGIASASRSRFENETSAPLPAEASARVMMLDFQEVLTGAFLELGLDILAIGADESAPPSGFFLGPVVDLGTHQEVFLSSSLKLRAAATGDITEATGLIVRPGDSKWTTGLGNASVEAELFSSSPEPIYLFGSATSAHVSATGLRARFLMENVGDDVQGQIAFLATGAGDHKGLQIHIPLGDADGLIRGVSKRDAIDIAAQFSIIWSSKTGFSLSAGAAFAYEIPDRLELGPVTVLGATARLVAVGDPNPGATLSVTTGVQAKVGPVGLSIAGFGLAAKARQTSGASGGDAAFTLGDIGLDVGFVAPTGAGLSLDTAAVSGSGFLEMDSERGRYFGGLQLAFSGFSATAVGLIDTQTADGGDLPSPGFSLLIAVSARFPAIQLGYGFALHGIGGLIGLHRDVNYDALRAGLTTGALDSVLFPADPGKQLERAGKDLGSLFPVSPNRHVIAPMVLIGWGSPKIVDIEVGIIFAMGGPIRIYLLGQLSVAMPPRHAGSGGTSKPVLLLNLDVVGELDFASSSLSIDAALRDSSIAGFPLTGTMAARLRWDDDPAFAISFGGFHPDFQPDASFPAQRPLALVISKGSSLRIIGESYLAVTSNTVQFGGRAELVAKKSKFTVNGWFEYHALFVLSPFSFAVALGFDVALKFKGRTFASIGLTLALSGPRPWRAKGSLKIKIVFVSFKLKFNVSWGSQTALATPPRSVWPELEAALSEAGNWASVLPPASRRDVFVIPTADHDTLRVHPHGVIEIRQKLTPFGIKLERFGAAPPQGDDFFATPTLTLGGKAVDAATIAEPFAPSQFVDLTEDERLSRPSFERMTAGIRLGSTRLVDDPEARRQITVVHETGIVQPTTVREPTVNLGHIKTFPSHSRLYQMSDAGRTRATSEAVSQFKHQAKRPVIAIQQDRFTIAESASSLTGTTSVSSRTEAEQALRSEAPAGTQATLFVLATSELS